MVRWLKEFVEILIQDPSSVGKKYTAFYNCLRALWVT
jgi:hypothetical protein